MTERPTVYVLRLRASDLPAALRGLRILLKRVWRDHGLRALSVTEELGEIEPAGEEGER
jgi:hypothetical protein